MDEPLIGDETRFRAVFERTYPSVARYAHHRGYRGADAEDLVAATFEVAWRRLDQVPDGDGATPWLLAVARNTSRNADRRARSRQAVIQSLTEVDSSSAAAGVEDRLAARQELLEALAALKEIDRELIVLVAWDGLDTAQAGRVLGLRPGAARSRLHRARQRLARLLDRPPAHAAEQLAPGPIATGSPTIHEEQR